MNIALPERPTITQQQLEDILTYQSARQLYVNILREQHPAILREITLERGESDYVIVIELYRRYPEIWLEIYNTVQGGAPMESKTFSLRRKKETPPETVQVGDMEVAFEEPKPEEPAPAKPKKKKKAAKGEELTGQPGPASAIGVAAWKQGQQQEIYSQLESREEELAQTPEKLKMAVTKHIPEVQRAVSMVPKETRDYAEIQALVDDAIWAVDKDPQQAKDFLDAAEVQLQIYWQNAEPARWDQYALPMEQTETAEVSLGPTGQTLTTPAAKEVLEAYPGEAPAGEVPGNIPGIKGISEMGESTPPPITGTPRTTSPEIVPGAWKGRRGREEVRWVAGPYGGRVRVPQGGGGGAGGVGTPPPPGGAGAGVPPGVPPAGGGAGAAPGPGGPVPPAGAMPPGPTPGWPVPGQGLPPGTNPNQPPYPQLYRRPEELPEWKDLLPEERYQLAQAFNRSTAEDIKWRREAAKNGISWYRVSDVPKLDSEGIPTGGTVKAVALKTAAELKYEIEMGKIALTSGRQKQQELRRQQVSYWSSGGAAQPVLAQASNVARGIGAATLWTALPSRRPPVSLMPRGQRSALYGEVSPSGLSQARRMNVPWAYGWTPKPSSVPQRATMATVLPATGQRATVLPASVDRRLLLPGGGRQAGTIAPGVSVLPGPSINPNLSRLRQLTLPESRVPRA